MRKTTIILVLFFLSLMAEAQVMWFDGKTPITYSIPKKVEPVVKIALDMWKSDMQQVTGMGGPVYFNLRAFFREGVHHVIDAANSIRILGESTHAYQTEKEGKYRFFHWFQSGLINIKFVGAKILKKMTQ